jgi:phage gp45-like
VLTAGTATVEDLTEDRIVVVGEDGKLIDYAGLTFNGDDFTVSGSGTTLIEAGVANVTSDTTVSITSENDITITSTEGDLIVSVDSFDVEASGQIDLSAPDGVFISSSTGTQVTGNLTVVDGTVSADVFTGSFSGSFDGEFISEAILTVTASDGTSTTIDLGSEALTFATSSGALSQGIEITATAQTITFSLADDITVGGLLTTQTASIVGNTSVGGNLTIEGDLVVQGDVTEIQTTNLLVEDRFILLNSGSVSSADPKGGIIIDEGGGSGSAFFYTSLGGVDRWSLAQEVAHDSSAATPTAYIAAVVDMAITEHANAVATYEQVGNIKIEDGEVFIYV